MIALLAAVLIAVPAALPAQDAGVEGVVRTSEGDRPLAYARVELVDGSVADWTDAQGRYHLHGLEPGEWEIQVVHPGHDSLGLALVVPGDRPVRLDITLQARPGPTVDALADFEPFQVEYTLPALRNAVDVATLMRQLYPPELARARIGGEAVLRLWLDEEGRVVRGLVVESSGQTALDSIAITVSENMRFRPARSGRDTVRVIVRIPIVFTVPETGARSEGR